MGDNVKKAVDDVKDSVDEMKHKTAADIERAKREAAGDEMTTGEKARSVVDETEERAKAGVDKAKREIRDHT